MCTYCERTRSIKWVLRILTEKFVMNDRLGLKGSYILAVVNRFSFLWLIAPGYTDLDELDLFKMTKLNLRPLETTLILLLCSLITKNVLYWFSFRTEHPVQTRSSQFHWIITFSHSFMTLFTTTIMAKHFTLFWNPPFFQSQRWM